MNNNNNNNYIPSRKKRIRYKFITRNTVVDEKPGDDTINYFYQISVFKNPYDGYYHARRFSFNGNGKKGFLDVKYYNLTKKQYKKFRREAPPHKYKCYNTYTLENINFPTLADMITSQSNILERNYKYSGFSPFHRYK